MSKLAPKILVIAALIAAVAIVFALKQNNACCPFSSDNQANTSNVGPVQDESSTSDPCAISETAPQSLPRLLELGSHGCTNCQLMEPVLQSLTTQYQGRLQVDFIDVRRNRAAVNQYNINMIPTQILFDAQGNEIFRHEGFFAQADIIETFNRHGITFDE
ncbi:MAG: thioredoxin family protein [Sedimentisphaerales bacterium]|nr:thioredoxin family protein [Sedimentisphaerales bacterium]